MSDHLVSKPETQRFRENGFGCSFSIVVVRSFLFRAVVTLPGGI